MHRCAAGGGRLAGARSRHHHPGRRAGYFGTRRIGLTERPIVKRAYEGRLVGPDAAAYEDPDAEAAD